MGQRSKMSKKGGKTTAPAGFDASAYTGNGVFEGEVNELKEAFDTFDADLSGMISVSELIACFKKLGFDEKHGAVTEMLQDIDQDGNGEIDFGEFFALMTMKFSKDTPREDIEKVFKQFDADKSGDISIANLKAIARQMGDEIGDAQLADVLKTADLDGDGLVTLEDFVQVMQTSRDN